MRGNRASAVGLIAMAGLAWTTTTAQAAPISPAPGHVDRTWSGTPWTDGRTYTGTPWTPARTYTPPAQTRAPLWVTVQSGDTLWQLAATYLGSGYEWETIARLNGIDGTTIYAGSLLRVR
jgi:nucleoid-associated protein YgaU